MATQKWALTPGCPLQSFWGRPRAIPTSQEVYRKEKATNLIMPLSTGHPLSNPLYSYFFSQKSVVFKSLTSAKRQKERHCKRNLWMKIVFLSSFWWKDIVIGFPLDFYLEDREYRQTWLFKLWWVDVSFFNYFQVLYRWTTDYIIEMAKWIWKLGTKLEKLHH